MYKKKTIGTQTTKKKRKKKTDDSSACRPFDMKITNSTTINGTTNYRCVITVPHKGISQILRKLLLHNFFITYTYYKITLVCELCDFVLPCNVKKTNEEKLIAVTVTKCKQCRRY